MNLPDFRSPHMLTAHIQSTLDFYEPHCVDPSGGFYHFFQDDGQVYDRHTRHLVSSTRFIFNYAMAFRHFGRSSDHAKLMHGLRFLREVHRHPDSGAYVWELRWENSEKTVIDDANHCYGLAFVLLAYAHALMAGVAEARQWMDESFELMEQHFWQAEYGLYADQCKADWSQRAPYRGQNANMHACEAMLAAYQASGERRYLLRAELLAEHIVNRQANLADGLIWEHYHTDWSIDWKYNRDDRANLFRPWGFQPGHLTEWAKLLLILERHRDALDGRGDWLLPRAMALFDTALETAWDRQHLGIHYGFDPAGAICDGDKYFWVQAESFAAAALLAIRSGQAHYWDWYDKIWAYSWQHFIDHRHGAWYRVLSADNRKLSSHKSPAGKVDYHTMGACYEVLDALKQANRCSD